MNERNNRDGRTDEPESDDGKVTGSGTEGRRRRLLAVLGLSGSAAFIPPFWHKPIVKGLVLPAHAQTSPADGGSSRSLSDPCDVELVFEFLPIGVNLGCTNNITTQVIPVVSGSVIGDGDLSGISIIIESQLSGAAGGTQNISGITTTDGSGNYQLTLDGNHTPPPGESPNGPHFVCAGDGDCESDFPMGGTVFVTASSPEIPGAGNCSASFDCEDINDPVGSLTERGTDQTSNRFFVEMQPIDAPGKKT